MLENNGDEGGRRAKHELDLLLQIINNIKPRATALLLRDCPTKQKIWAVSPKLSLVSCLFKIVTCLFEIVNIWSPVLCSHIMPLFWPDTWSPLIQYDFQNTAEELLLGELKKTHFVVFFQPFSFFSSFGIPTVLRVNGPMVCCGFKLQEAQISVEQFKSFFEAQTGWLWGIQRRVKLVKHCFAMVLQWWWWGGLDVSVKAKVFTTVPLLLH